MKQSKLLKKLLTNSERSFIVIDREFVIIDTSYGAARFSECPYEPLFNKDIRQVFPETVGLEEVFNNIWLNQLTSFEIKGICRSNNSKSPIYFNLYIIATNELEESDGNIIICIEDATEIMTMSQDLMQRANESELLANELAKSKKYIDKVVLAMADALIVTDRLGIIKTINPATIHLFGYTQDELINNSISLLFHDSEQLDLIHQKYLDFAAHDTHKLEGDRYLENIEILCLSKAKEEILISFSCSPISNHRLEHDPASAHDFVYVGRDITELRRKEQELLAARQFAEHSAKAKSIFLANMSHEIRTPMNGVLGMTDLLLGTPLDARQQDFVENIRLSGNLLLSLINRILDLSKLDAGELKLENLPFNLENFIEETLELFALQAHKKGLELNASFAENLPTLLTIDTVRLRQIMMNLIGNAIKFTEHGEVLVKIARDRDFEQTLATSVSDLANHHLPQIYLRFSVIDTGMGIDAGDQDKLFKPFSQVDTSTTRLFGGTGLGLAISRQLVELMQGEIGVLSPVDSGRGTHFWFRIPFTVPPQPESQSLGDKAQGLAKRRILVIDGHQHSRDVIRYHLAKFGATLYEANNLKEAIACLDSVRPLDAVLIDWNSIGSNGVEVAHQLHAKPELVNLPLIAILTTNCQGEIQSIINQGFCGYVRKPLKRKRLLTAIYAALNIELPLDSFPTNSPIVQNARETNSNEDLSNLKILLAEDNIVNQKVMMSYLSQLGCKADLAENGERVLQSIKTKNYDIILMDCQMPLLDGYATTQAIRQLEANHQSSQSKHLVIIAMTANAFTEDRDRCLAVGMDDYVSKPIRREKLRETLQYWHTKSTHA